MPNLDNPEIEYSELIAQLGPDAKAMTVTIQVTDDCNLACSYCYQHHKQHHIMSFDIAKKFLSLILDNKLIEYHDFSKDTAIVLDFIGGEPFLAVDLMDQICDYFSKELILRNHPWQYHYMFSVCSNGTLYFQPAVQNFIAKYSHHLSFNISIDGNKELHDSCRCFPNGKGSYDIAMSAVNDFRQKYGNSKMGSKITLSPDNIQYTSDAIIDLIKHNYTNINANCVFEPGWTEKHATILYNEMKKISDFVLDNNLEDKIDISLFNQSFFRPKAYQDNQNWCGGNGQMLAVDWKGDLYPCIRYMESSLGTDVQPIIIGNINIGIDKSEQCKHCIETLQSLNRINQSTQECITCPIAEGCSWCQAFNYEDGKGEFFHRATYICIMHKARALGNHYFWNKYFIKKHDLKKMKLWVTIKDALKIISVDELNMLKSLQYPII